MKKIIIICGLFLIAFVIFCFKTGYQLPQRDRHKDWTILKENTDPNFVFQPALSVSTVIKLAPSKLLMLVNADQIIVVDSCGTVLRRFNISDPVYIDNFNNRLITGKPTEDSATTKAIIYFSYDLNDFSERPIKLIDYPLTETIDKFEQRQGRHSAYPADSTIQNQVVDSLLSRQYSAAHEKDSRLFAGLHPVLAIMAGHSDGKPLQVKYYTDDSKKLYNIRPLTDSTSFAYDAFSRSMALLYPAWLDVPDLSYNRAQSPNFSIADKSTITANNFNFNLGINFSPTGGSDHAPQMYFEQSYLHYYAIRLGNSTAHFKIYDDVHIQYVKETAGQFMQLNIPSAQTDTLAFLYDGELYKVYQRRKAVVPNKRK